MPLQSHSTPLISYDVVGIFGYKAQLNWMFRRAEN